MEQILYEVIRRAFIKRRTKEQFDLGKRLLYWPIKLKSEK